MDDSYLLFITFLKTILFRNLTHVTCTYAIILVTFRFTHNILLELM